MAIKDATYPVGAAIEIAGLQQRADLNGRLGVIVDVQEEYVEVHLDSPTGGERVKCRRANVKVIPGTGTAGCHDSWDADMEMDMEIDEPDSKPKAEAARSQAREAQTEGKGKGSGFALKTIRCSADTPHEGAQGSGAGSQGSRDRGSDRGPTPGFAERYSKDWGNDREAGKGKGSKNDRFTWDQQQISYFKNINKSLSSQMNHSQSWDDFIKAQEREEQERNGSLYREQERQREEERLREREQERIATQVVTPGFSSLGPNGEKGAGKVTLRDGRQEDRSQDWICACGERNFLKRRECHKCNNPRAIGFHALEKGKADFGQMEWEELLKNCAVSRSRSRKKKKKKKKRNSSSSSSSSSSRSKKKKKKKKRSSSSSESSAAKPAEPSRQKQEAPGGYTGNPEIEKAKAEALERLLKLKSQPKEERNRNFRGLLREWHPDKHPDNVEVATAVFQFLQKGKALIQD